jgi:rifampicin phosphotransferase
MNNDLRSFDEIGPGDGDVVGGKGLSLGLLAQAGLPVPPGFCLTSAVHRRHRGQGVSSQPDVAALIRSAYQQLGEGVVAVRSSATAEDGAVTSFAGQQETILGVQGAEAVCAAIDRCWVSLDTDRARAYRRHQGVEEAGLAMAVVVQRLVDAEAAGVLFTRNPLDPAANTMLVEASWGLGESVVSGKVMPDRFRLDHASGQVLDRQIAVKTQQLTAAGQQPVPVEKQKIACLDDAGLAQLADLGRQVEAFYKGPRDVEWAWADGRFWLLQARPITTADAAEREQVRREEIAALAARSEPGGTVWSKFNLSESLPEPTPMTWAIVGRLMAGKGGSGQMLRDFGCDPDPSMDDEGAFELVCGRTYCNLSREARLYSSRVPHEHSFKKLKANLAKAQYPVATPKTPETFWSSVRLAFRMPGYMAQVVRAAVLRQTFAQTFPQRFRAEIIPAFVKETDEERRQDLSGLTGEALLERLEVWIQRTLYTFARDSLKPTALAHSVMAQLEQKLARTLGPVRAKSALQALTMGVHPDEEADLPQAVREAAQGRLDRVLFRERFGHHGGKEMELAEPRWSEDQAALDRYLAFAQAGGKRQVESSGSGWEQIATEAKLPANQKPAFKAEVELLQTLLGLRETAKHYLLRGYALIRRILVELDNRHRLNGGIFYLLPDELPRLIKGEDFTALITQRKRRRMLALSLEAPPVVFSDDLEALGRPFPVSSTDKVLTGVALSAGVGEGPALVLHEPTTEEAPVEEYILVCPSTDPAWVPLFLRARGLVMETGGVLSHGAIVAREFGLPGVAGLPGVMQQIQTGQRLRIDGVNGTVTILS